MQTVSPSVESTDSRRAGPHRSGQLFVQSRESQSTPTPTPTSHRHEWSSPGPSLEGERVPVQNLQAGDVLLLLRRPLLPSVQPPVSSFPKPHWGPISALCHLEDRKGPKITRYYHQHFRREPLKLQNANDLGNYSLSVSLLAERVSELCWQVGHTSHFQCDDVILTLIRRLHWNLQRDGPSGRAPWVRCD